MQRAALVECENLVIAKHHRPVSREVRREGVSLMPRTMEELQRALPSRCLEDILPVVFSEVMHDCDLFVGVCSIGADRPGTGIIQTTRTWNTGKRACGELSTASENRKAIVAALLPKLSIGTASIWAAAMSSSNLAAATCASSRPPGIRPRGLPCRLNAITFWR